MEKGHWALPKGIRGERVKKLREKRDLTQGQLATYSGVAQSWISSIERGDASNVGTEALIPIAKVLETSADYILGLTDDPRSPLRSPVENLTLGALHVSTSIHW